MKLKIVIDGHDLDLLADFWCAALDYERLPAWVDFYVNLRPIGDATGRPPILLQRVPEAKAAKNRLHIDLHPHDGPATVERMHALGATTRGPLNTEFLAEHGTSFQVMSDPEGNEFCVIWRVSAVAWDEPGEGSESGA